VLGLPADQVGEAAAAAGLALHELTPVRASLEDAFLDLVEPGVA
jgi:ABC-2 type transport system ATP-binding protein